jgi:hypothetical protein
LLDPSTIKADAFTAGFNELQPYLTQALANEVDKDQIERGVMAAGIAKAGEILSLKYTLQITNVPYLSRGKQNKVLQDYCEINYSEAKGDLATVFLEKMLKSNKSNGIACSVIPQNWLFLTSYKKYREKLLKNENWSIVARLGTKSFQTPMWDFNVMLISLQHKKPISESTFTDIDVSKAPNANAKDEELKTSNLIEVKQLEQLNNPDSRVISEKQNDFELLSIYAQSATGQQSFDRPSFYRSIWELPFIDKKWKLSQTTSNKKNGLFDGLSEVILWEDGKGRLASFMDLMKQSGYTSGIWRAGEQIWGMKGVAVSLMSDLNAKIYCKEAFDQNTCVVVPTNKEFENAIITFLLSIEFRKQVRQIDNALKVAPGSTIKVPFDLAHWQKVAEEKYPNGLPKPYSDDATQWLFHGHPIKSDNPLQVAVARLLGYRWPAENDREMELADEARELITAVKAFDNLSDDDGIFCIPSVNGEEAGADRVRGFLQAVYGEQWSNSSLSALFTKEGASASNLEDWLRKEFFVQHCKLFQNRPFIWHIWDGRADGFSVLVNYHTLTKDNFSKLIYTYLGDWIRMCEAKKNNEESGAEGLLSAALKLKEKLELILEGEAPYDIFVRWKPLSQQPIGWEPDLNDGVRLNVRPFVEAGVLRSKFNVKWGIDRGKNPAGSHWGEVRDNDTHLSLEEKRKARETESESK